MIRLYEKIALGIIIPAASVMSVFITPELNMLQKHFSVKMSSIGLIMSYYLTGYVIGQTLFGYISKNIGYKRSIQSGLVLALLSVFIQTKAFNIGSFKLFLAGRFLIALGLSSGLVCGFAYLKDCLTEKEEKTFLSLITVIFTFSIYLSIVLSGNIIKYYNIDFMLWLIGLYILVILTLSLTLKHKGINRDFSLKEKKIQIDINTSFKLITYSFCLSISTIYAYCYTVYAPIFLIKENHLSPAQFSNYNFTNLFAILLGSYIFKKISNKVGEYKLILFSMIIMFTGSILYLLTSSVPSYLSVLFFISISFVLNIICGAIYPAATYKCLQMGESKSTSSAIMNTFKIGMPTIAIVLIGNYSNSPLVNLSMTISLFSFLFIALLLILPITSHLHIQRSRKSTN